MSNVIQLPRPQRLRPSPARLGYYLRVGRNDHKEAASRLAEGERAYSGLVFNALHADRHRDLIASTATLGLDAILDTRSQQAAFLGGFSESLGRLPWGLGRQATLADFRGHEGQQRAEEVADFAREHGFSAVLAPTHLISSANDPWFAADREVAVRLRASLAPPTALFYSLAITFQLLRNADERQAIVEGLRGIDMDALWLKIDNFGSDSSGDKVRALVEACQDFHQLGVPVVMDHAGGLPGLATLAFGASGGMAHAVMMFESFKASAWKRPRSGNPRVPSPRVYLQNLDMLVSREQASALLGHSVQVRGRHACRNPLCCPRGYRDMIEHPARHYLFSRARQVEALSAAPSGQRAHMFMDEMVRPRSDALAAAASLRLADERLGNKLMKRHLTMGRFRGVLSDMIEHFEPATVAQCPLSRHQREE